MRLAMGSALGVGPTLGGGIGPTLGGATGWLVRERVRWAIGSAGSMGRGWLDTLGAGTTGCGPGTRTLGGLAGVTLGWVIVVFGRRGDGRESRLGGVASF